MKSHLALLLHARQPQGQVRHFNRCSVGEVELRGQALFQPLRKPLRKPVAWVNKHLKIRVARPSSSPRELQP